MLSKKGSECCDRLQVSAVSADPTSRASQSASRKVHSERLDFRMLVSPGLGVLVDPCMMMRGVSKLHVLGSS